MCKMNIIIYIYEYPHILLRFLYNFCENLCIHVKVYYLNRNTVITGLFGFSFDFDITLRQLQCH